MWVSDDNTVPANLPALQRARQSELLLGNMRRAYPGYARQPLPAQVPIQFTNGFVPDRAAKKMSGACRAGWQVHAGQVPGARGWCG